MIITTSQSSYKIIPSLSIVVNSELKDEFDHLYPEAIDERKIIERLRFKLSDDRIEKELSSLCSITFNLTDNCNFRCKYCAFSGNYTVNRKHNINKMSFSVAQKAIKNLIHLITNEKRQNKTKLLYIGFYGGEALLELELIKNIMDNITFQFKENNIDNKFDLNFHISTNGYLLNYKTVDFLVKNNFTISISLDGPANEHNKFRVTEKGEQTWNQIWKNLQYIKSRYPEFYNKKVGFLCTLHPKHNFEAIDNFFLEKNDYFKYNHLRTNLVEIQFLKDYIKKDWFENYENQESQLLLKQEIERLNERLKFRLLNSDTNFTAMCFPGGIKLFVSSDGIFHVCERVKSDLQIGNVDLGIDFNSIRSIVQRWNEEIIRNRCWECDAWSICSVCLSHCDKEEGIAIDCKRKDSTQKVILDFLTYKEKEELKIKQEYFNNVKEYIHSLE